MKPLFNLLVVASLTLGVNLAVAQEPEAPSVTVTPIKGPLYMLKGRGGTMVASVGEDGILLIDADYAEYAPAHDAALKELAGSQSAPRFLLNTHWHGDHVGGNLYFSELGSVVIAHENIRKRMSTQQEIKAFNQVVEPSPKAALPVVTYADSLALHFNDDDIEVQHFPAGHTDGDSVVFFSAQNVVHVADYVFEGQFPFVDVGAGGNVFGLIRNIDSVLQRVDDETIIVAGHGGLTDKADLVTYRDMLLATSDLVSKSLKAGRTRETIIAEGLGEKWADWGGGFIKEEAWIGFIIDSV